MTVYVIKKLEKEAEKLPTYIQQMLKEEITKLKAAKKLGDMENVEKLKGIDEPYYRLKFNDYRLLLFYDSASNTVEVRKLKHRKDAYKKHNLP